jgi:hypothetical protein
MLLPMPHRKMPLLLVRSRSFLRRMASIGSPASVPNFVQQNDDGNSIEASP